MMESVNIRVESINIQVESLIKLEYVNLLFYQIMGLYWVFILTQLGPSVNWQQCFPLHILHSLALDSQSSLLCSKMLQTSLTVASSSAWLVLHLLYCTAPPGAGTEFHPGDDFPAVWQRAAALTHLQHLQGIKFCQS